MSSAPLYDFSAKRLDGAPADLSQWQGKVLLIVNTASECGFTPQFTGLQALHEQYKERGFEVLGFPCNQFGGQEPGDSEQIGAFCQKNYGVDFPMFEKIEVNGDGAHPLYQYLKKEARGVLGTEAIKWNFTKFLVDRQGRVIDRFAPTTKPEELAAKIEALL
ncbi:glutathione peroxidase [Chitinimonas koreensis]|uniref:glutathione peroxidase n=1 Tax=Chitinimonas koreensis TaxID=356302 RepID=UPI00040BB9BE|nr:glutathione peroxidase [Chitinimonas koreensis]QNM97499.1 glutathione peroxidase [Chitinimonas koreensis]